MTQHLRLRAQRQTALPLVQMREQHPQLRRQRLLKTLRNSPTTTMTAITGTNGLIRDKPI
jgi:hypothetical protein